jgi:hypothetical protein
LIVPEIVASTSYRLQFMIIGFGGQHDIPENTNLPALFLPTLQMILMIAVQYL